MKFWYVVVYEGYAILFQRKCLSVGEANTLLKQKKEEYSDTKRYQVTKESF